MTPSWPPIATLTCSVAVSMPRISTAFPHTAGPRSTSAPPMDGPASVGRAHEPGRRAAGADRARPGGEQRSSSGASRWIARWSPSVDDDVAPLDEHDALVVGEIVEREIVQLVLGGQAVDVGVVQGDVLQRVAVHQVERRRGDRLADPQRGAEALGERRLAGAHLPGQHDDVPAQRARPGDRRLATACVPASEVVRTSNMAAQR